LFQAKSRYTLKDSFAREVWQSVVSYQSFDRLMSSSGVIRSGAAWCILIALLATSQLFKFLAFNLTLTFGYHYRYPPRIPDQLRNRSSRSNRYDKFRYICFNRCRGWLPKQQSAVGFFPSDRKLLRRQRFNIRYFWLVLVAPNVCSADLDSIE
jgi:hypothetical protein